eukprot:jgi/Psemu1/8685/gm1.8685_g
MTTITNLIHLQFKGMSSGHLTYLSTPLWTSQPSALSMRLASTPSEHHTTTPSVCSILKATVKAVLDLSFQVGSTPLDHDDSAETLLQFIIALLFWSAMLDISTYWLSVIHFLLSKNKNFSLHASNWSDPALGHANLLLFTATEFLSDTSQQPACPPPVLPTIHTHSDIRNLLVATIQQCTLQNPVPSISKVFGVKSTSFQTVHVNYKIFNNKVHLTCNQGHSCNCLPFVSIVHSQFKSTSVKVVANFFIICTPLEHNMSILNSALFIFDFLQLSHIQYCHQSLCWQLATHIATFYASSAEPYPMTLNTYSYFGTASYMSPKGPSSPSSSRPVIRTSCIALPSAITTSHIHMIEQAAYGDPLNSIKTTPRSDGSGPPPQQPQLPIQIASRHDPPTALPTTKLVTKTTKQSASAPITVMSAHPAVTTQIYPPQAAPALQEVSRNHFTIIFTQIDHLLITLIFCHLPTNPDLSLHLPTRISHPHSLRTHSLSCTVVQPWPLSLSLSMVLYANHLMCGHTLLTFLAHFNLVAGCDASKCSPLAWGVYNKNTPVIRATRHFEAIPNHHNPFTIAMLQQHSSGAKSTHHGGSSARMYAALPSPAGDSILKHDTTGVAIAYTPLDVAYPTHFRGDHCLLALADKWRKQCHQRAPATALVHHPLVVLYSPRTPWCIYHIINFDIKATLYGLTWAVYRVTSKMTLLVKFSCHSIHIGTCCILQATGSSPEFIKKKTNYTYNLHLITHRHNNILNATAALPPDPW